MTNIQITEAQREITIDKGGEYYKAIAALEIKKWLGISSTESKTVANVMSASNPFARRA